MNSKIQEIDPLVLDSVRDILHLLTVKTFVLHSAAEFRCKRVFFILKTAEIERVAFSDSSRF